MGIQGPFWLEIRLGQQARPSRQAYDDLYSGTSLSQIESFYLWLLNHFALPSQGRLLDVSCGAGELVRLAQQRGLAATGIDISEVVARSAHRAVSGPQRIVVGAGEALPFPEASFDFVTNIGSLEHFIDPAQGVREMARVLRPGGRAFVLVPNTFSLLTNVWHAFRTGETSVDAQPIQRYGSRSDWTAVLERNGLWARTVVKYERIWPRLVTDWGYYLTKPKQLVRLLATPFVPLNLAFCFLFTCERMPANNVVAESGRRP
jgi:SAM-dependent methyltransferase